MSLRKIAFLTGTRADFGKLKPLMKRVQSDPRFELHVFVTGMHMLKKYGSTHEEVRKSGFENVHLFMNQNSSDRMDHILAKTITGLSDYIQEICPDMLVIHGDRVEALAGASVGTLNNIRIGHVEGGEVSGTVDELIRHAVTKLSHIHFVANHEAHLRLKQLGERETSIYIIGSPDIDVMESPALPTLKEVRERYKFDFEKYALVLFHPVTTELSDLRKQVISLVDSLLSAEDKFIVIFPNNDHGTEIILEEYRRILNHPRFRVYPSIRFEYFLSLLKNAQYILGNSSAGVREAPHFGVPTINLGSRQTNRVKHPTVINSKIHTAEILNAIKKANRIPNQPKALFGEGKSAETFHQIISEPHFWDHPTQKYFVDLQLS